MTTMVRSAAGTIFRACGTQHGMIPARRSVFVFAKSAFFISWQTACCCAVMEFTAHAYANTHKTNNYKTKHCTSNCAKARLICSL